MSFDQQLEIVKNREGFIAALDQSGGSTPKALRFYGIGESEYSGEDQMYDRIHEMRTRIVTSPQFGSTRILGAILFEQTMRRQIEGLGSAQYLWERKQVVPFLKVDKGLAEESNGVQLMKPMQDLDALLEEAGKNSVFGTKMRSVIKVSNPDGVKAVVDQQFEIGKRIIAADLVPILEPEVDINSSTKAEAEQMLLDLMMENIKGLDSSQKIMLKLSLPDQNNHFAPCNEHPNVIRVVALSGGYSREEANARLSRNQGMTASFSRALTEGLSAGQSDSEFNQKLDSTMNNQRNNNTRGTMMNAKIKWVEDQKMLGESGTGHSVVMDALDSGKGVSPMEMLLLGVGGCTSLDVLSILKKSRQDVVDFEVQVKAEREQTHPRIFHEVRVHYVIKGRKISTTQVEHAIKLSTEKYCGASITVGRSGAKMKYTHEIIEL